jgi:fumarate reductase flavoprotein subunit
VYRGAGEGYRGTVVVEVRVEDGAPAEIRIVDHGDDEYTGGAAMEELLDMVLTYHTTDLDAVSGATESSAGFLAALEAALAEAAISGPEDRPRDSAGTGRGK